MKVTLDEFFNYRPTVTYPEPMSHDDDTCADQGLYTVSVSPEFFNADEEDILI